MSLSVLIAVTHLLGVGHLARAAAIGRALAGAGHRVTLVSGGLPAPLVATDGLALVQLPPVRTRGEDFRTLLDEEARPIGDERLGERRRLLLNALATARPDVVVTELFPFGRRVLAAEFMALVEAARARRPRPLLLASVRDILVAPAKPDRLAEAQARLALYDAVLVHGDPALVPLDASWPVDAALAGKLRYTGYVADARPAQPSPEAAGAILVSGGGSAASLPLYRAALGAADRVTDRPWRILVGGGVAEADFAALRADAPDHAILERARPDFPALMAGAALSVSQAGYNTVVDLLRAGTRAVLVPFEGGRETEQRLRAERLVAAGRALCLAEVELSAESLAEAVRAALARPAPPLRAALDGAARTAAIVEALAAAAAPAVHRGKPDWSPLTAALDATAAEDRRVPVWWRDDDAVAHTPALDRLLGLARATDTRLALACIPACIEPSLAPRLADAPEAVALVHGLTHANHAPPGEKKAEFGTHRGLDRLAADAQAASETIAKILGKSALPVFVPPWNRIAPDLVATLPRLGFTGLSTFGGRATREAAPGLVQVNTHLDPIDWRGGRSLLEPGVLVARLAAAIRARLDGTAEADEPVGLLTHHLIHDEAAWTFCAALLERLAGHPAVAFADARRLFAPANATGVIEPSGIECMTAATSPSRTLP